jgi:hypothetical protein
VLFLHRPPTRTNAIAHSCAASLWYVGVRSATSCTSRAGDGNRMPSTISSRSPTAKGLPDLAALAQSEEDARSFARPSCEHWEQYLILVEVLVCIRRRWTEQGRHGHRQIGIDDAVGWTVSSHEHDGSAAHLPLLARASGRAPLRRRWLNPAGWWAHNGRVYLSVAVMGTAGANWGRPARAVTSSMSGRRCGVGRPCWDWLKRRCGYCLTHVVAAALIPPLTSWCGACHAAWPLARAPGVVVGLHHSNGLPGTRPSPCNSLVRPWQGLCSVVHNYGYIDYQIRQFNSEAAKTSSW